MQKCSALFILLFAVGALVPATDAEAWIDTGHKIISMIAWEELTPKTRIAVLTMLKEHPRYKKDLLAYAPHDATAEEMDRHVFAAASTWPDMIREQEHPMHAGYSHPAWHYIDIPFLVGEQPAPVEKKFDGAGPQDIVEALGKCTADLKADSVAASEKAISLCWILHLIGDIHQPLHCATRVSAQFPQGDRGGYLAIVLRDPPYPDSRSRLHLIWDELPGQFHSETLERYEAEGLRNDLKFSREMMKDDLAVKDFSAWAKESYALAVENAYLNGKLEVAADSRSGPRASAPGLPPGYIANAERVAMRQMALAGYRLGDFLNAAFDGK